MHLCLGLFPAWNHPAGDGVVQDLYCIFQTLLHISCLCVLAGSHWSFVGNLQRRGRGPERVCHFFLGLLLHVEIKGCYLVPPFQCRDRSSSAAISETALVSLKNTHCCVVVFLKYLSAVLSLTPFYPLKHVKEASIVGGLLLFSFIFAAKYVSGKCLYI